MNTVTHRGHVEIAGTQFGATLILEPGRVTLEVASAGAMPNTPEHLDLVRFTSNTGYCTLIDLFRRNHNVRFCVAGLSTYSGSLAFESAHFRTRDQIRSRTWSMQVGDIAKILHVNGVRQEVILPKRGGLIMNYTMSSPPPVTLDCSTTGMSVSLGQHIVAGGNIIDGPTVTLTYPADISFPDEVDVEVALVSMHRIRQLFSLVMGRVLPIIGASMKLPQDGNPHEVIIHGLQTTDMSEKPANPIFTANTAAILAPILDRWLARYDELEDAIRLHMSGLEQRKLPAELRLQIFVQALEALHRRTAPTLAAAIDSVPILDTLRQRGISSDVIDRVAGVLAHAHEPGLRQRLRHYWDLFEAEIAVLRPSETRRTFIGRVAATRNHYAHRTVRDEQVLGGVDLWDATETIKAMSHMALLSEIGANTAGMGRSMLDRRFTEYAIRE